MRPRLPLALAVLVITTTLPEVAPAAGGQWLAPQRTTAPREGLPPAVHPTSATSFRLTGGGGGPLAVVRRAAGRPDERVALPASVGATGPVLGANAAGDVALAWIEARSCPDS